MSEDMENQPIVIGSIKTLPCLPENYLKETDFCERFCKITSNTNFTEA